MFGSLGSDTGGSIRLPASMNGLFDLKPTYGRVSRSGCFPRAISLDCVGPLARSAHDCALLLEAVAGWDAQDPSSRAAPVPGYSRRQKSADAGTRVAVIATFVDYDAQVQAAFTNFPVDVGFKLMVWYDSYV